MDFRLPGIDDVHATAAVRQACSGAKVVCLTGAADEREVEALYEAGAVACLRKDQELEEIVTAIQRAAGRLAA
jgi:DNA-binding NarL/FixJ family response regulator